MNLYLLRHAPAEDFGERFPNDSERPLTAAGEKEMFRVAEGIKQLELKFDLILTSPFLRAQRTAEIVAEVCQSGAFRLSENLASGENPDGIIRELKHDSSGLKHILLVGHEPDLSRLVSLLTTGGPGLSLNFKKAALCRLKLDELRVGRCANLKWLLTPEQLEKLGTSK